MIDEQIVRHVTKLAALKMGADEEAGYCQQLRKILEHIENLNRLDTSKVEPLSHILEVSNVYREDVRQGSDSAVAGLILKNSPESQPPFIKVPKVID